MTNTYGCNSGGSLFTYTRKLVDQSVNHLALSYHQHSDLPYFLVRVHISTIDLVAQADEGGVAPQRDNARAHNANCKHVQYIVEKYIFFIVENTWRDDLKIQIT